MALPTSFSDRRAIFETSESGVRRKRAERSDQTGLTAAAVPRCWSSDERAKPMDANATVNRMMVLMMAEQCINEMRLRSPSIWP